MQNDQEQSHNINLTKSYQQARRQGSDKIINDSEVEIEPPRGNNKNFTLVISSSLTLYFMQCFAERCGRIPRSRAVPGQKCLVWLSLDF